MAGRFEPSIKDSDMQKDMLDDVVREAKLRMSELANESKTETKDEREEGDSLEARAATAISEYMNRKYDPTWHCIVGKTFSTFVTAETKTFAYIYIGQVAVVLFKAG